MVTADAIRQIGMNRAQPKRLKELEKGNQRLRKAVSDLTPEKLILAEAAKGTRQHTRVFSELQFHYLFEDRFGRPGKGNDKYPQFRDAFLPMPQLFPSARLAGTLRCVRFGVHQPFNLFERSPVVRLGFDRFNVHAWFPAPY